MYEEGVLELQPALHVLSVQQLAVQLSQVTVTTDCNRHAAAGMKPQWKPSRQQLMRTTLCISARGYFMYHSASAE